MKTYVPPSEGAEKKWVLLDAAGAVVGRLAAFIAHRLRGKHLPIFTPHIDCGDHVVVVNAEKVAFTGRKFTDKTYYRHTGHPGGIKSTTPERLTLGGHPERILESAVRRMLARGPLGRTQFRHLRVYSGDGHPHEAQNPERVDWAAANRKNLVRSRSDA